MSDVTQKKLQELIDKANDKLSCGKGTECYYNKHVQELESIYKKKLLNVKTAPEQLDIARKNYYTFKDGKEKYYSEEEKRLTDISKSHILKINKNHKNIYDTNNSLISKYELLKNYEHMLKNSIKTMYKEDKELEQNIDNEHSDLDTANRKVYYEIQEINSLSFWYNLFRYIYIFIFVIFIYFFIKNKFWKSIKYIFILIIAFTNNWVNITFAIYDLLKKYILNPIYNFINN